MITKLSCVNITSKDSNTYEEILSKGIKIGSPLTTEWGGQELVMSPLVKIVN